MQAEITKYYASEGHFIEIHWFNTFLRKFCLLQHSYYEVGQPEYQGPLKALSCCCHPFLHTNDGDTKLVLRELQFHCASKGWFIYSQFPKSVEENQICSPCLLQQILPLHPSYKVQSTIEKPLKRLTQSLSFSVNNLWVLCLEDSVL